MIFMAESDRVAYNVDENTILRRFLYENRSRSFTELYFPDFTQNFRNKKRKEEEITILLEQIKRLLQNRPFSL